MITYKRPSRESIDHPCQEVWMEFWADSNSKAYHLWKIDLISVSHHFHPLPFYLNRVLDDAFWTFHNVSLGYVHKVFAKIYKNISLQNEFFIMNILISCLSIFSSSVEFSLASQFSLILLLTLNFCLYLSLR